MNIKNFDEAKELVDSVLTPSTLAFKEFLKEIEDKVVDKEVCDMLEGIVKAEREMWLKIIQNIFKGLEDKKGDSQN